MSVRIEDLTASDFPGIDAAKFNEWKRLRIRKSREQRIVLSIGLGILLILSVLTGKPLYALIAVGLFMGLFIVEEAYLVYRLRYRRLRQLDEELKMSARLKAKRKGRPYMESR